MDDIVLVDDDAICAGLALLQAEARLAVEPAPAAAIAAAMGPLRERLGGKRVALVICGANIDAETYGRLLERGRKTSAA
jgi:threonine dehydratase